MFPPVKSKQVRTRIDDTKGMLGYGGALGMCRGSNMVAGLVVLRTALLCPRSTPEVVDIWVLAMAPVLQCGFGALPGPYPNHLHIFKS